MRISEDEIRRILDYNQNSGIFIWRVKLSRKINVGQIAGHISKNGYVRICIHRKVYLAHQLAWLYVYGKWVKRIDHKDRDPSNNRIENLRECTHSQNLGNSKKNIRNTSGYKGVSWNKEKKKYQVRIKDRFLGYFDTVEQAAYAYDEEAKKYFGDFANLNDVAKPETLFQ